MSEKVPYSMKKGIKDFNARQLMAMALMRTGVDAKTIIRESGITKAQYDRLLESFQEGNLDKVTSNLIENWGNIVLAKIMRTTETAVDALQAYLEEGEMKDAKYAADVFSTLFDKFRLQIGKSTENVATVTQRINQMIEAKTAIQKPNQSQYHDNITFVDTAPPSLSEVL